MFLNEITGFSMTMNLKNDLKAILWDNTLSRDIISAKFGFNFFFARINTLLDKHAPNHELSKKETLKTKP